MLKFHPELRAPQKMKGGNETNIEKQSFAVEF
jgi:hypothetical protein